VLELRVVDLEKMQAEFPALAEKLFDMGVERLIKVEKRRD